MKYIEEYLKDVIKVKSLGELTTEDDELNGMSGEMVYIDGKCSDIFISHADYANWLEKQGESNNQVIFPSFTLDDVLALQCCMETVKKVQEDKDLYDKLNDLHSKVYDAYQNEKQGEQKPVDKVEPKFMSGEWVVNKLGDSWHIDSFDKKNYQVSDGNGNYNYFPISKQDEMRPWTIQDAKDGDVLVSSDGSIFLLKDIIDNACRHYVALTTDDIVEFNEGLEYFWEDSESAHPATKGQRDLLFQKMYETGYEWNADKKKLKKIEQKSIQCDEEELTDFEALMLHIGQSFFGENAGLNPNDIKIVREQANLLIGLIEQKPTDKVEPKFKVGDWCIDNEDGTIFQIVKVLDNTYTFRTNEGKEYSCTHYTLENIARLWTIQDAKDGDVLITVKDKAPFIFKGFIDKFHPDCPVAYGGIVNEDGFDISSGNSWWDDDDIKPANEEQRNFLFQKIKEAGYEWDAKNKKFIDLTLKCN